MPVTEHIIHVENGKMATDTPEVFVRAMAKQAASSASIVFHFHGGLVKEASGRETAERLFPVYEDAGAFPVFYLWESGLLETLRNNLAEIAQEQIFRLLWKRVAKVVLAKMAQDAGQRAAGVLPLVDARDTERAIEQSLDRDVTGEDSVDLLAEAEPSPQLPNELSQSEQLALELELQQDAELQIEVTKISNGLRDPNEIQQDLARSATGVRGSSRTLMDPGALDALIDRPQPGDRGALSFLKVARAVVTIAVKVISRMVRKRDHGWHATIIEEILREFYVANVGGVIWELMKKDTADCFKADAKLFGGTCFLDALANEIAVQQTAPRIVLVGHSTGAVFISEFIECAVGKLPANVTFGIIFLAAASRFEKTAKTIQDHQARIRATRSFGMKDDVEKADRLVPVLYPHSLLYFVSGVVEGDEDVPLVGMQRFYDPAHFPTSNFADVEQVRAFLDGQTHGNVWSTVQNAGAGLDSLSGKHGDFDNDLVTLASIRDMIKSGF
jgi:hypothetical protein